MSEAPNTTRHVQQLIGWEQFEAERANRFAIVRAAAVRAEADLHMLRFAEIVAAYELREGRPLRISHQELAARPMGLCASVAMTRRTVARAVEAGLVRVLREPGRKAANAYAIDWGRITGQAPAAADCAPRALTESAHSEQTTAHSEQTTVDLTAHCAQSNAPHAHVLARAGAHKRQSAKTTSTNLEMPAAERERPAIGEKAAALVAALWPAGRWPMSQVRDQRLVYRVCRLRLDPAHAEWVAAAVDEAAAYQAERPLAYLQHVMKAMRPDLGTLLAAIRVPRWALSDPRLWADGHERRAEEPAPPSATAEPGGCRSPPEAARSEARRVVLAAMAAIRGRS